MPDVQDDGSSLIFIVLSLLLTFYLLLSSERAEPNLKHIRPIGHASYLLSYIDAFKFLYAGPALLRKGYEKLQPGIFRISTPNRWLVIVTSTQHIEELRKAPADVVSLVVPDEADAALLSLVGHPDALFSEDTETLARRMTQSLTFMIHDLHEEIVASLASAIPFPDISTGWSEVDALDLALQVVTRTSSGAILGSTFSHAPDYRRLSVEIARTAFERRFQVIPLLFPRFIKRAIKTLGRSYRDKRRLQKIFGALLKEYRVRDAAAEPNASKQNDLLSPFLHTHPTDSSMLAALFNLSLSANESLSMNFLHVLYHLAANPKYASPMRKEIESVVTKEGWTKSSLEKMRKVDSFVKESMRMSGTSALSMIRTTLKPFTFSDGTSLPAGAVLCTAADARHLDPRLSSSSLSPEVFDGFRYSRLHEQHCADDPGPGGGGGTRYQLSTATSDYLAWGYGRHTCPGRFFAAAVLKMLLAHVVLGYNVRFEDGMRPEDVVDGVQRVPNPRAKVLFRKR